MNDNLLCTIEALECHSTGVLKESPYRNKKGVWGYKFLLWHAGHYHFISISNCEERIPTLSEVAYAVRGILAIEDGKWGFYKNAKRVLGFFASAKSSRSFDSIDHWYMMGRSNDMKTLRKMSRASYVPEEIRDLLDQIDRESLDLKRAS